MHVIPVPGDMECSARHSLSASSRSYTKSECIRFVHSCCSLVLFFSSDALDSGGDLRLSIEMGQLVQPWSICLQVPYHITHDIASALPFVVPRAFIMHITKGSLDGIGSRPQRWGPKQLK